MEEYLLAEQEVGGSSLPILHFKFIPDQLSALLNVGKFAQYRHSGIFTTQM